MAVDCFLKIGDIKGESTDDKHKEWIEILSYSHGVSQMGSGSRSSGGAASGARCDHQDFSVTKVLDTTSPTLNLTCCNGTHIKNVTLELCRATGNKEKYMEYKLDDVILSSVAIGGSSGGELPIECVTFNYGKVTWNYIQTDHQTGATKGNVEKYWSLITNKGG
jgi:type VI secretion system secreted protein Hcp